VFGRRKALVTVVAGLLASGCGGSDDPPRELLGAYRFADGRVVSLRPSLDGTLRHREFGTGASGRLYPDGDSRWVGGAGFSDREPRDLTVEFERGEDGLARSLRWTRQASSTEVATRIGRESWLTFSSDGTELAGRLHLPDGDGPYPAIVLVHGSGETPGSRWLYDGDFFVAHGIAVLAFDKRGTGASGGDSTFDFDRLARDVAAAVDVVRTHPAIDGERIGIAGYSQGGWVAPLAASMTSVRFVIAAYGLVESPAEEARQEMLDRLRLANVDSVSLAAADSLIVAAIDVVASGFEAGWERFDALKQRYGRTPWRDHLRGTPVDRLLRRPRWMVKIVGPRLAPPGLDWNYDSVALLDTLDVPTVWFLGDEDRSAPNDGTQKILRSLRARGRPIEIHVYEDADHGMLLFEQTDGVRRYTGYAADFWHDEVDAARRHLAREGR